MKPNLREFIQEVAAEHQRDVDENLENFIFQIASRWADRRIAVVEAMRDGNYQPSE